MRYRSSAKWPKQPHSCSTTLICHDAASTQAVTFARHDGVRSITLDGDVYEPSGTMSGHAAPSGFGMLVRAQELRAAEERVADARLRDGRRGRRGEPACVKLRLRSMSCDCCRSRLEPAMPPGCVMPHLIVLWDLYLMKGPPLVLDRHATNRAQVVHRRHGHRGQGCAREADSGRGGINKLEQDTDEIKINKEGKLSNSM